MRSRRARLAGAAVAALAMASGVIWCPRLVTAAEPTAIPISSYDIEATAATGWGGWSFDYTGSVTDTGRRIDSWNPYMIADHAGGSGTLNDGTVQVGQLFTNRLDLDGVRVNPRIVLHLAQPAMIDSIELIGDTGGYSWAAGFTTRVKAEIGDASVTVDTVGYGPTGYFGNPLNDRVVLGDTALAGIATDTVVLTDFEVTWPYGEIDQWVIAEIQVIGTSAVVTYTLLRTLTADWVIKEGIRDQLLTYLTKAETAESRGNLRARDSLLESYRALLRAQAGKSIDASNAETLSELSTQL
jgi:hypothetical protein